MTDPEILTKLTKAIAIERAKEYIAPTVKSQEFKVSLQMVIMMLESIHEVGRLEINEVVRMVKLICKPDCELENDFEGAIADAAYAYVMLEREGENFTLIECGQIRE